MREECLREFGFKDVYRSHQLVSDPSDTAAPSLTCCARFAILNLCTLRVLAPHRMHVFAVLIAGPHAMQVQDLLRRMPLINAMLTAA